MSEEEKKMEMLWKNFSGAHAALANALISECSGRPSGRPDRGYVVSILRGLCDARRDFMKAAGECDDAWINDDESQVLRDAEMLSIIVAGHFAITDEEIEAAGPVFKTSTGRITDKPQFPTRFDA